jgi:2-pyrone-4,6-dicarboxylate lactonase
MVPPLWDAHAHVIEDPSRFPLSPGRGYDPPHAPLDDYLAMLDRHGIHRGVLVQPSVYGFDNRCMLDALDRADGRLVGVAVPAPDASPADLEALHRRGVRGVRCNLLDPGGIRLDAAVRWQPILRELGWHVAIQLAVEGTADMDALLDGFDVPVVIDHMGRPSPGRTDPSGRGVRRLVDLVRVGACLVKLSAPYRLSREPAPWADVTPLARALLAANPAACLWASDWPHTDTDAPVRTRNVLAALESWCPDAEERRSLQARAGKLFES